MVYILSSVSEDHRPPASAGARRLLVSLVLLQTLRGGSTESCSLGDIDDRNVPGRCTELNLARAFADPQQLGGIMKALELADSSVTSLNLRSNSFKSLKLVQRLARMLEKNTKLTHLYMPHTALGDGGVLLVAGALARNQRSAIVHLNLFNNGISDKGADGLAALLR